MTNNKPHPLTGLFWFIIGTIFVLFTITETRRIRLDLKSAREYSLLCGNITPVSGAYLAELKDRLRELQNDSQNRTAAVPAVRSITEIADRIRGSLQNRNIQAERFKTSGKAPDETVEFTIQSPAENFLTWLMEASEDRMIAIAYLNIKPHNDGSRLVITMKVQHGR
ncbi:hypothetical protein FACS189444_2130 [Spirochaetia bacterium]|nr:hypothetical protein FACS189444_2130 [Spirochaetia bacterium]